MIATRQEAALPEGLRTVDEALHRTRFRILPFLGPAFIACVAYIDPGNFATNIAGGSKFGYRLVWVIVVANLEPATLMGIQSNGMVLTASQDGPFGLLAVDRDIPSGAKVR